MLKKALLGFFVLSGILMSSHALEVQGSEKSLEPSDSVEVRCIPVTLPLYLVNENNVNFRTGPGTDYPSRGQVHRGQRGARIGIAGRWIHVHELGGENNGKEGWILDTYLTRNGNIDLYW